MAGELTATDVYDYTGGRLSDDGGTGQVSDMLKAAVTVARRDAGWHVTPIRTADTRTIDGPDSRILYLPTRKLVALTSIVEDGTALTPLETRVSWSVGGSPGFRDEPVRARKRGGGFWTAEYQGITVVMTHGYTDAEAEDWRRGVLSIVDQMASAISVGSDIGMPGFGVTKKRIDDVDYTYGSFVSMAEDLIYSMSSIFDDYKLPSLEFM
jgi:hypothetical protein